VEAAQQHGIRGHDERCVSVEVKANSDSAAEIRICDSGAGPKKALAASLFEPFVTDKPQGAGLGLAMAKDVIDAHGGSIHWTRENGRTRFEVTLPLARNGCTSVANSHR
jgi:nitrogen-specific signal transduction histidine kinase